MAAGAVTRIAPAPRGGPRADHRRTWPGATIVIVVVLVVQHTLLDAVRVDGAHPDVMLLLPMAAGYAAGPDRGAVFGFVAGLLADLFLPTTFGLSALVGCLLGLRHRHGHAGARAQLVVVAAGRGRRGDRRGPGRVRDPGGRAR